MEIQKDITIKIVLDNNEIKLLSDILFYASEKIDEELEKDGTSIKTHTATLEKYNNKLREEVDKIIKLL